MNPNPQPSRERSSVRACPSRPAREFAKQQPGATAAPGNDSGGQFSVALSEFRRLAKPVQEPRRSRVEQAILNEMRGERREDRMRQPLEREVTPRHQPPPPPLISRFVHTRMRDMATFLTWALEVGESVEITAPLVMEKLGCSHATAYRRLATLRNLREAS